MYKVYVAKQQEVGIEDEVNVYAEAMLKIENQKLLREEWNGI